MKKIIFLSAIITFSFSCNEKKQELPKNSDLLSDNLKGKVEQTVTTNYRVDGTGKIGDQDSCCVVTVKYDKKGYLTEYTSSNKAGTDVDKETMTRYANGAMKDIKNSKNGNQTFAVSLKVDNDGKYISAEQLDSSNKLKYYFNEITQNDYGQLTGMKKYNADSTFGGTMADNYDKSKFTSGESKDSSGKVIQSSVSKYDDKNNIIESDVKNVVKDSTINRVTKYKYDSFDDQGNWTQRTETNGNGKLLKIIKREITYYND